MKKAGDSMKSERVTMSYLDRTVGELVAEDYARAAVFTGAGIDFCCRGGRTLAEACKAAGTSTSLVVDALDALDAVGTERSGSDPSSWSLDRLVSHIEDVHHAYVRRTLPVLERWTDKIARVHGRAHPELLEVRTLFGELTEELSRHMRDEEDEVFPHLVSLEDSRGDDAVGVPMSESLVDALEDDHEHTGSLTRRIREVTDGFSPPPDACATYTATFALLSDFETDLHRHVHLENNILFPRARETLEAVRSRAGLGPSPRSSVRPELEDHLDDALRMTFPASDPIALSPSRPSRRTAARPHG